jgi:endonuclease/exonuclease/phosphatase family metal-dependent hydrolase
LSTLPLTETRTIELPRERQRRIATTVRVVFRRTSLLVVNVHLENRASLGRGLITGDLARGRQMDALLAQLPADADGVLAGDLNIWLGTSEPAYRAAAARFPLAPPERPFLTFANRLALDHVLLRLPAGWDVRWAMAPAQYGSDHRAVLALIDAPDGVSEDPPSR